MKNTRLIADYAIVALKHFASTAAAPHLPRWAPPAGPEAPERRSASASPRTAGEKGGERRARSRRGAGRGHGGHLTILARVLISASTQSGQSRSPQKRNRCGRTGGQRRQGAPHALPAPRRPTPPHHVAAAPRSALLRQSRLCDPEPHPGRCPLRPSPPGRSGRGSAGPVIRDPGQESGRRRGRGSRSGSRGTPGPSSSEGSPQPAPHSAPPANPGPVQSQPPVSARLSPLCPITAALSIRARSRPAQPAQAQSRPARPLRPP